MVVSGTHPTEYAKHQSEFALVLYQANTCALVNSPMSALGQKLTLSGVIGSVRFVP